jgi:dTDP-glucose 4,6-dehydratase
VKILVTGSQGTLGKPLVNELLSKGHKVVGADLIHAPGDLRTDVAEYRQVERTFAEVKPDVCYHLAGEFGRINGNNYYEQLWRTNCLGTKNMIEACIKHDTHLIFASSSEAYGHLADKGTLHEGLLDSTTPHFHNEYALTKFTNEQQIKTAIPRGLEATILRFFNVYGPGEYYSDYRSVICLFIYRAIKKLPVTVYSKTYRSFLYIDDWVRTVVNVLDSAVPNGSAYNIGSSEVCNIAKMYSMVCEEVGQSGDLTLIDNEESNIVQKIPSLVKAREVLGLQNTVELREGIKRTVAWMRKIYG